MDDFLMWLIETLDGCCCFWACPGSDSTPVAMVTCGPCRAVWTAKQLLVGVDLADLI